MNCIVDIKKEGNKVLAYLPFDPRVELSIPKGSIYVKCVIENVQFNLPNHIRPVSLVAFGYPAEEKQQPNRFELGKIHLESW